MCGIVGLFAKSPEVEERLGAQLGAMLAQMADRGPDSAGLARLPRPGARRARRKLSLFSRGPGGGLGGGRPASSTRATTAR